MMGPRSDLDQILRMINFGTDTTTNCTDKTKFPKLGFVIEGKIFEMEANDYMDREYDASLPQGTDSCWAHLMAIGDMGRGPLFVLGMPFLRKFYTAYDIEKNKIGMALAKQGMPSNNVAAQTKEHAIPLVAVRPGDAPKKSGNASKKVGKTASVKPANAPIKNVSVAAPVKKTKS